MQLTVFEALRHCFLFFFPHLELSLGKFVHEVVHLEGEFRPNSLVGGREGIGLLIFVQDVLVNARDSFVSLLTHSTLEYCSDYIDVTFDKLLHVVFDDLGRMVD